MKKNFVSLAVILFLYALLQHFGILNLLAPGQLADTKMGYGMLFVIGLITSVHCIAMCGGINLSQCIPQPSNASDVSGSMLMLIHLEQVKKMMNCLQNLFIIILILHHQE